MLYRAPRAAAATGSKAVMVIGANDAVAGVALANDCCNTAELSGACDAATVAVFAVLIERPSKEIAMSSCVY